MNAPAWFLEDPPIKKLLHDLLDRLEGHTSQAGRSIAHGIDPSRYPQFFKKRKTELDPQYLEKLRSLDHEHHLFRLDVQRPSKSRGGIKVTAVFNVKMEEKLRLWLERPRIDAAALIWRDAIIRHGASFDDAGAAFPETPILMKGKGSEEIVAAFSRIGEALTQPSSMTLRELSAHCFWGNSKFLDKHRALVQALFNKRDSKIKPRSLLVHCYLPKTFEKIVLVENQDSFLTLADQQPADLALIYCAGFSGANQRLRDSDQVTFSFIHGTTMIESFKSFWFQHSLAETEPGIYFWGDLDSAAMQLFAALKELFPHLEPWNIGYSYLLEKLRTGFGHQIGVDLQGGLDIPSNTGSEFADLLCDALKQHELFVDQEAFNAALLHADKERSQD